MSPARSPDSPDRPRPAFWFTVACIALFACLGCGRPAGRISGIVTLNERPAASARLRFDREGQGKEIYVGLSQADGAYQVDYKDEGGLPPGRYHVAITYHSLPGGKPLPEGEQGLALKQNGQAVETVVIFEEEIKAGPNRIDFELAKGKKLQAP